MCVVLLWREEHTRTPQPIAVPPGLIFTPPPPQTVALQDFVNCVVFIVKSNWADNLWRRYSRPTPALICEVKRKASEISVGNSWESQAVRAGGLILMPPSPVPSHPSRCLPIPNSSSIPSLQISNSSFLSSFQIPYSFSLLSLPIKNSSLLFYLPITYFISRPFLPTSKPSSCPFIPFCLSLQYTQLSSGSSLSLLPSFNPFPFPVYSLFFLVPSSISIYIP